MARSGRYGPDRCALRNDRCLIGIGLGAAAAAILEQLFGTSYALTDRSLERCPDSGTAPRKYVSFAAMAKENALSRIYLGVHYRMDCEEGLRLGRLLGQRIAELPLYREDKLAQRYE